MQVKKNPNKNLNKNSMLYFQIGLSIVLFVVLISVEWKSYSKPFEPSVMTYEPITMEENFIVKIPEKEIKLKPIVKPKAPEFVPDKPNNFDEFDKSEPVKEKPMTETDHSKILGNLTPIIPEIPEDVPVAFIQEVPVFPGCERYKMNDKRKKCMNEKLNRFIQKNFDVQIAQELGLDGWNKILTQFKVNHKGEVEFMGARAPHPKLEEEAKRVIEKMPEMLPGKQGGRPVNVIFGLPINFQVKN